MSDADLREELAALELLLGRPALWEPIPAESSCGLMGGSLNVAAANPRPRFEARRDELRRALSETKVTMLSGYGLYGGELDGDTFFIDSHNDRLAIEQILPSGAHDLSDWEITVTRRPHLAPAKKVEGV